MVNLKSFFALLPLSAQASIQIPLQSSNHVKCPFTTSFDKFVENLLSEWHTPGMAIAVVNGNKTYTKVKYPPKWVVFDTIDMLDVLRLCPPRLSVHHNLVSH